MTSERITRVAIGATMHRIPLGKTTRNSQLQLLARLDHVCACLRLVWVVLRTDVN